jgi:uncharacterized membrane protein YozB (DUF420 family)
MGPSLSKDTLNQIPTTWRGPGIDRWSYVCLALVVVGLNVAAFGPSLIEPSARAVPLPLTTLVAVHAAVSAAWLLVFLAQTVLVATGRTAVHRRLGIAGVLLAAAFVVTGPLVTIAQARRGFDLSSDLVPRGTSQSAGVSLSVLFVFVAFGLLVAGAVWYRRRPEVHKRLMLLAILGPLMGAPVSHLVGHWDFLRPWAGAILPLSNALLLAALPIHDRLTRGRIHPVSLWGAIIVMVSFNVFFGAVAPTVAWQHFAEWLVR